MNRSDIDQKFLDEITNNLYPTLEPADMATEMAGGMEPAGAQPMTLGQFATSAADVPAGLLKGAVQGTVGLPGDIESLTYGVRQLFNRKAGEGALDAFLRGLEEKTILPTTEDVKKWLDENVDPLVPEGADPRRIEGAKIPEFVGELGGAGKTAIETARAAGRATTRAANIAGDKAVQAITGNPQATAMGVLEEAGQMSPLARIVPGVQPQAAPQRSDIGFYSAVEKAVLDSKQEKGTGAQFLAQITKTQGVKPEELKWTGLDEFLKGKKSVTKQEIQGYLQANRVDVREVRLGDDAQFTSPEEALNYLAARRGGTVDGVIEDYGYTDNQDYVTLANNIYRTLDSTSTKFSQYTLPGGENYREILLTLPPKSIELPSGAKQIIDSPQNQFYSTHFDQPNILAHMRVNDRVVDGKKTLFIEEIQSDWHQAGRKQGYAGKQESFEQWYNRNKLDGDPPFNKLTSQQIQIAKRNMELGMGSGVPDAPFKTSWHELTLKRAIQEASEKGYDQIAFTTGRTQAERYDLSKQIDVLIPTRNQDGTYTLDAFAPGSSDVTEIASSVQEADLERYVGKDLAKKIVDEKLRPGEDVELSGVDLQVGGEGMAGFYDNILPKSLEKLGKKFDAKVGKTEMDGVEVWQMDITPKMRETVTKQGQPLFQIGVGGGAAAGAATMQDNEERM